MTSIVLHYKELALKGKNRPWFVARLVRNIREAIKDRFRTIGTVTTSYTGHAKHIRFFLESATIGIQRKASIGF